jgi:hypothetical protein
MGPAQFCTKCNEFKTGPTKHSDACTSPHTKCVYYMISESVLQICADCEKGITEKPGI